MEHYQTSPKLLLPADYIRLATNLIRQAQRRIYIVCLNINRCPETDRLIDEVKRAARRGVDVHIGADLLSFICDHDAKVASRVAGREMIRTSQLRAEFLQSGAEFHWLGIQRVPYLLGRTHSKWTVIDDDVFSFGGVNLSHAGIAERTDYVFHFHSPKIADRLAAEQHQIEQQIEPNNNRTIAVTDKTIHVPFGSILLDSGRFGRSGIYRHATKLAREAESLLIVSQYCPTGRLGKIIRSKPSRLYFNPKGSAADAVNNFMIGSKTSTTNQNNLYTRPRYLHAKFIVGTMANGSRQAITGSHNFAAISGRAGTREIALETTDPAIIDQLESFFHHYVE